LSEDPVVFLFVYAQSAIPEPVSFLSKDFTSSMRNGESGIAIRSHRVDKSSEEHRTAPRVREPSFLVRGVLISFAIVVLDHAVVEDESHSLQLMLAVVAWFTTLFG